MRKHCPSGRLSDYGSNMAAEETQEKGRRAVALTKRWLEATTYVELPFNSYQHTAICQVELLSGKKTLDMFGFMLGEEPRPVYVENKDDANPSRLHTDFLEFLATAYSATAKRIKATADDRAEFIWVSTGPFNQSKWSENATPGAVRVALEKNSQILDGQDVDDDLVATVASRIWVLVMSHKQIEISLTHDEVMVALHALKRKEPTL